MIKTFFTAAKEETKEVILAAVFLTTLFALFYAVILLHNILIPA